MKLRSREDRVKFFPNVVNKFLSTVLCHELKELVRDVTLSTEVNLSRETVVGIQYTEKNVMSC
jgi:hypothetical protein